MKRARSDSLTGGTGDVNPQYIAGAMLVTTPGTLYQQAINLPVFREATGSGKAWVCELIRMYVDMPEVIDVAVATTQRNFRMALTTSPTTGAAGIPFIDSTTCIAFFKAEILNLGSALGTGAVGGTYGANSILTWDFTDGAGHGLLVGTDNVFVTADMLNYSSPRTVRYKILYRFKKVSLQEYIGIVQQQNTPVLSAP